MIIASSSSGLTMSEIQSACRLHPERCVIGHPFNPPHLVPLVEIVGGAKTSEATIERAAEFYTGLGKQAVRLRKEVPGHVANRLQAALAREVYYLVAEGVVSAADVDKALCWGPGLRWGIMGNVMLNHLGGGPGGIEHFFQQFTGPMTAWWKVLGQPVLTPEVQKKLIDSVHAEVGSRSIAELEAQRDEVLLGLLELRAKAEKTPAVLESSCTRRLKERRAVQRPGVPCALAHIMNEVVNDCSPGRNPPTRDVVASGTSANEAKARRHHRRRLCRDRGGAGVASDAMQRSF